MIVTRKIRRATMKKVITALLGIITALVDLFKGFGESQIKYEEWRRQCIIEQGFDPSPPDLSRYY
jgi:hypothetical protein